MRDDIKLWWALSGKLDKEIDQESFILYTSAHHRHVSEPWSLYLKYQHLRSSVPTQSQTSLLMLLVYAQCIQACREVCTMHVIMHYHYWGKLQICWKWFGRITVEGFKSFNLGHKEDIFLITFIFSWKAASDCLPKYLSDLDKNHWF